MSSQSKALASEMERNHCVYHDDIKGTCTYLNIKWMRNKKTSGKRSKKKRFLLHLEFKEKKKWKEEEKIKRLFKINRNEMKKPHVRK